MKFRQQERDGRKVRVAVDLTPMIDVVFQLIIFFMLSSTFVVQSSINIEMPTAETAHEVYEQNDITVTLLSEGEGPDGKGRIVIDDQDVGSFEELARRLAEEMAARENASLLIRPDAKVPSERLVRIFGIAGSVGIEKFSIAALPPPTEE